MAIINTNDFLPTSHIKLGFLMERVVAKVNGLGLAQVTCT
jgi:hypothetical protein